MTFVLSKVLWFIVQPSTALLLVLLLGLVMARRQRHARGGLRLATLAGVGFLAGGMLPLGTALLLPLEQRFPQPAIAAGSEAFAGIIVLGGAEDGRVSRARGQLHLNEAAERITEGVRLARWLPKARLAFAGGAALPVLGDVAGADAVTGYWSAMGIDRGRIQMEGRSRNTHENALFIRAVLAPKPGERWLLVTSAAHMPRAMGVFRRAGLDVTAYPVDYRTTGWGDLADIDLGLTGGLRRLDDATREWIGLVAYWLLGRTSSFFPAPDATRPIS